MQSRLLFLRGSVPHHLAHGYLTLDSCTLSIFLACQARTSDSNKQANKAAGKGSSALSASQAAKLYILAVAGLPF
eukprot:scaffold29520_cov52-Prasinocladus_malaysianus.AAC.1